MTISRPARSPGWAFLTFGASLPDLAIRADFNVEGPGGAVLMDDVEDLVGDRGRLGEELVGLVGGQQGAGAWLVDQRVDGDVGDMHALLSQVAGERLAEDALRRLGRRENRRVFLAPVSRGVAGGDDGAPPRRDHRRGHGPRDVE